MNLTVTIGSAALDAIHIAEDHPDAEVYLICTTQKRCEVDCQDGVLSIWPPCSGVSAEATLIEWGEGWHAEATPGRYTVKLLLVRRTDAQPRQAWPAAEPCGRKHDAEDTGCVLPVDGHEQHLSRFGERGECHWREEGE